MGNSAAKETRSPAGSARPSNSRSGSAQASPSNDHFGAEALYTNRHGRSSRSELGQLLGFSTQGHHHHHHSHETAPEHRREAKAEREAKKKERERQAREKERERSMREEGVDGGYLVTLGVYIGTEDYSRSTVRQLMLERRMAPFWRGLNDHNDSWTEYQLIAAARGLPIPAPDERPPSLPQSPTSPERENQETVESKKELQTPAMPITHIRSRSQSDQIESSSPNLLGGRAPMAISSSASPQSASLLRGRAKTFATLTTSSKNYQPELTPREIQLPKDPNVNGQPVEAHLYKDASECPICFLYYPPYLNRTRCCDQPICSECFVQIKRPDPHPPEHQNPSAAEQQAQQAQAEAGTMTEEAAQSLVSEPAQCPYCAQPEFGVTYEPPPFRRGLAYANQSAALGTHQGGLSSSSSLQSLPGSGQMSPGSATGSMARRRTTSLSATAPGVISTDMVRPDWAAKLAAARAHAARRSAAATALHTAAYLMNSRPGGSENRGFPGLGRRVIVRRAGGSESPGDQNSPHASMWSMQSEDGAQNNGETSPSIAGPPRQSSRRNRIQDLEEMMMMEAIRLSLASEEERRKKEEKEAKKDAKKKAKEERKNSAGSKSGAGPSSPPPTSPTSSTAPQLGLPLATGEGLGGLESSTGSFSSVPDDAKGKAPARDDDSGQLSPPLSPEPLGDSKSEAAQAHLERSRAQIFPAEGSAPLRPSHLRTLSNASDAEPEDEQSPGKGKEVEEAESPQPSPTDESSEHGDVLSNYGSLAAMIGINQSPSPSPTKESPTKEFPLKEATGGDSAIEEPLAEAEGKVDASSKVRAEDVQAGPE